MTLLFINILKTDEEDTIIAPCVLLSNFLIIIYFFSSKLILLLSKMSSVYLLLMPKIKCLYIDIKNNFLLVKQRQSGYWYSNGYIREMSPSIVYANNLIIPKENIVYFFHWLL